MSTGKRKATKKGERFATFASGRRPPNRLRRRRRNAPLIDLFDGKRRFEPDGISFGNAPFERHATETDSKRTRRTLDAPLKIESNAYLTRCDGFFAFWRFISQRRNGAQIKIELNVPTTIPTLIANAKVWIPAPPNA